MDRGELLMFLEDMLHTHSEVAEVHDVESGVLEVELQDATMFRLTAEELT